MTDRLEKMDSDPIRLFVKPEPIKKQKVDVGRYRLISSVSVIDQIIDQMIFGWQNEKFIDGWIHFPTRVGWSPLVGGWKLVPRNLVVAIDKTAWDWTVKPWLIECELNFRIAMAGGSPEFVRLARWRYSCLYKDAVFVTSGGVAMKQKFVGVMKSGCVNTIVSNSIMQLILHYRVSFELDEEPGRLWVMGDDTLQEMPVDLNRYFHQLKRYCLAKDPVLRSEFAGFDFQGGVVNPCYLAKHAYNLLHFDPKLRDEMLTSYSLLYSRSSRKAWMDKILMCLGPLPSDAFRYAVWNGDD